MDYYGWCDSRVWNFSEFLGKFTRWARLYPKKLKMVTFAWSSRDGGQLRLWTGEPHGFSSGHVDSMGENLIAHICVKDRADLRNMVPLFLPKDRTITEEVVNGAKVWRIA